MSAKCISLTAVLSVAGLLILPGCHHQPFVPAGQLTAAQNHARELYAENQQLLSAQQQAEFLAQSAESDKQMLMQQLGQVETQLGTANSRIDNLLAERNELKDRYGKALTDGDGLLVGAGHGNPQLGDQFVYDPATGLNRFHSDVLFDLGSDVLRPEANPILSEFAATVNSGAASGMKILIVGHTDDHQIVRPETRQKHPTNWHLSTDRSAAVILALTKLGISPDRVAAMGYSEFQPLEAPVTDTARSRNRRVELYVVPNDPHMAAWDPARATR